MITIPVYNMIILPNISLTFKKDFFDETSAMNIREGDKLLFDIEVPVPAVIELPAGAAPAGRASGAAVRYEVSKGAHHYEILL